ncbi:MAG: formate dehydrogenase accessory sulfurtransferase FdhD [Elsteraceae bacterium]
MQRNEGSKRVWSQVTRYRGPAAAPNSREVAVETPVNLLYGGLPYAVMMASPLDLEDFAAGFSLTEGLIESVDEIRAIRREDRADGVLLDVELTPGRFRAHLARRRSLSARTGCGVCGVASLEETPRAKHPVESAPLPAPSAIERAVGALEARQPLNLLTRAVHAAAWCDLNGRILEIREDVGRHNALDKLIGARLRAGAGPQSGFILITSRCSFEMVEKTAIFGAPALVALSAPTSLAIERAEALHLALFAIARDDGAVAFTQASDIQALDIAS